MKERRIKFSLEETSKGHLVQHPAQGKASWMKLLRATSSQGWIVSRDADFATSPGNFCRYLTTSCRNIFLHEDFRRKY